MVFIHQSPRTRQSGCHLKGLPRRCKPGSGKCRQAREQPVLCVHHLGWTLLSQSPSWPGGHRPLKQHDNVSQNKLGQSDMVAEILLRLFS